jgi:hypothetical protein
LRARNIELLEHKASAIRFAAFAEMRLSRVRHECWLAGNLSSATPLSSIHGYGYGLAAVTVLLIVSLDGDLIDDFGDLEARLRAGERLLVRVVVEELMLAEHRPVRAEDSPLVGVALR